MAAHQVAEAREIEVKGHAIRSTHQVIRELYGPSIAEQVTDGLTEDFREACQNGSIVSGGWYPIAWYRQFHVVLSRLLPDRDDIARRIGRVTTTKDMSGIYQFILKLTSPELVARHFDKVLWSYLRGGEVEISVQKKSFLAKGRNWHGMTMSLWEECASGCEVIFESAGAESVTSRVYELGPGQVDAEFSWR
jgi:hypothetical protein